jgi:Zn-dependent M28 family amino/carboxypeptidase
MERFWPWPVALVSCMPSVEMATSPEPQASSVQSPCADADAETLAACVDSDRFEADVRTVAQARPPGSDHWRRVQMLCADTMAELGYDVSLHRYATGINVIGSRPGIERPSEHVVVGAHYDHIPGCAGADDNATGVAAVLEVARVLGGKDFPRTLVIACWDEEERGLVGSRAWTSMARREQQDISVYFNYDAIGYASHAPETQRVPQGFGLVYSAEVAQLQARQNRADFVAVVADSAALSHAQVMADFAHDFDLPVALLEVGDFLRATPVAVDLHRSDHASFWDAGYPAVMITDTAEYRYDGYHCRGRPDGIEHLDLEFGAKVVRASVGAIVTALRPSDGPGPSPSCRLPGTQKVN